MDENFWNTELFFASFEKAEDAFYFCGASTLDEIRDRMRQINQGFSPTPLPPPTPPPPPPPPASPKNANKMPEILFPEGIRDFLVFDTETTGLSPAIVCQIAYITVENGIITNEYDQLLQLPTGSKISKQAQNVHGISNDDCSKNGVPASEALGTFAMTCARILASGGRIVAHNSKFDVRAIRETRVAHGMVDAENRTLEDKDTFCTMKESKSHSPLIDRAGRQKVFKNEELYKHFYETLPEWAKLHCAIDDVRVTLLNYTEGLRRGWW